jgi:glycosyltransferase involved in cell wall biosynthesis
MLALKDEGVKVIGGAEQRDGFEHKLEDLGLPFVDLPIGARPISPVQDIRFFWSLYRWYRKEKPDVVHHFTIKPVIYGTVAARLAGVPRIVNTITGLGYAFSDDAPKWLTRLVELQYKVVTPFAHQIFFQNPDDMRLFVDRKLCRKDVAVSLPGSGVDTSYYTPAAEKPEKSEPKSTTFLLSARMLRDKGVIEFVEAARTLKSRYSHARFLLLGRRDEMNPAVLSLAELEEWQKDGVVEWLGEVDDVRSVVRSADVMVLPSYYREGTPRSLLEAASMEKPIITTDSVGCREVVENGVTGLLVPPRDVDKLTEAMAYMIDNPNERVRMGVAGRMKVKREFDETIVVTRQLQAYPTTMAVTRLGNPRKRVVETAKEDARAHASIR